MKRRSGKYLNAREYAERLRLSDNKDVQDFAEEFLDALDSYDELSALEDKINEQAENCDATTAVEQVEWLGREAASLAELEEQIQKACPEYEDTAIEDIIPALLKQLAVYKISLNREKPKQEYDL